MNDTTFSFEQPRTTALPSQRNASPTQTVPASWPVSTVRVQTRAVRHTCAHLTSSVWYRTRCHCAPSTVSARLTQWLTSMAAASSSVNTLVMSGQYRMSNFQVVYLLSPGFSFNHHFFRENKGNMKLLI